MRIAHPKSFSYGIRQKVKLYISVNAGSAKQAFPTAVLCYRLNENPYVKQKMKISNASDTQISFEATVPRIQRQDSQSTDVVKYYFIFGSGSQEYTYPSDGNEFVLPIK